MHYIEHSIGLCTESCTDNYRLCRFLVFMRSLAKSLNVHSTVFLKSYRVDSEAKEGVLIYPSTTLFGHRAELMHYIEHSIGLCTESSARQLQALYGVNAYEILSEIPKRRF
jgi:hypothetical protein